MAKTVKKPKKPQKRGPKERPLIITEDPNVALARLLNMGKPAKKNR